jgi:hypothetical protein
MKNQCMHLLLVLSFASPCALLAQEKNNIKYGKIDLAAFSIPDTGYLQAADAVYIADIGSSQFTGNNKSWFTLEYKRHVRIKINNSNGFGAADFEIPMYFFGGDVERVVKLKGVTYNLENDKVVETPLKDDQVFVDKKNKNFWLKKFTMPGVKVGSIIDVAYTIESDFIRYLRDWQFQGGYPRMWSEYEVGIPEILYYVTIGQGHRSYDVNTTNDRRGSFSISSSSVATQASSRSTFDWTVHEHRWVMKNVPALKEEPFTSTVDNHVCKVDFQLSTISIPNQPVDFVMSNWPKVVERMNENEYFGLNLYKNNNWLSDDIKGIVGDVSDSMQKAHKIYGYIRDNYTCIDDRAVYLTDAGLKNVVKNKKGSVADLNLLLVAMLQHEGVTAFPVILSTKKHGYTNELYPLMDRFNMTVAVVVIGDKEYYLDASDPMLGFGKLNSFCYNGHSRVITGDGIPVYLDADSVKEKKFTTLLVTADDKGVWEGTISSTLGYYESLSLREKLKEKGKESVITSMQTALTDMTIKAPKFELVDEKDESVKVTYNLEFKKGDDDDLIYFNPMAGEGYKENPFKSAERSYPVEMPYATDELYVATIEIPAGYVVDEVPKSAKVMLNESDGTFEYIIQVMGDKVMMRSRLDIKKANFPPEDYQTLRDFFGYVVKKHSEQIVFKKATK